MRLTNLPSRHASAIGRLSRQRTMPVWKSGEAPCSRSMYTRMGEASYQGRGEEKWKAEQMNSFAHNLALPWPGWWLNCLSFGASRPESFQGLCAQPWP
jgi:hypothetical protein